jgi:hypothetical protein
MRRLSIRAPCVVTLSEARGAYPKACPPRSAQGDNTRPATYSLYRDSTSFANGSSFGRVAAVVSIPSASMLTARILEPT